MELRRRNGKITQIKCERLVIKTGSEYSQDEYTYRMGVLYSTGKGKNGVIYFGNNGTLSQSPYIELKNNQERNILINEERENNIVILNKGEIQKAWLVLWHHELMEFGKLSVPFKEDGVFIDVFIGDQSISDETNSVRVFYSETDASNEEGNMLIIAEINLTNREDLSLINRSLPFFVEDKWAYRDIIVKNKFDNIEKYISLGDSLHE